jgi:hypothetical protein
LLADRLSVHVDAPRLGRVTEQLQEHPIARESGRSFERKIHFVPPLAPHRHRIPTAVESRHNGPTARRLCLLVCSGTSVARGPGRKQNEREKVTVSRAIH